MQFTLLLFIWTVSPGFSPLVTSSPTDSTFSVQSMKGTDDEMVEATPRLVGRETAIIPFGTQSSSSSATKISMTPSTAPTPSSQQIKCVYNATSDMYGIGVRTGFYIQSGLNILCGMLAFSSDFGRGTSAVMAFAMTVAYGLGFRDDANLPQLEIQLFLPMVAMLTTPLSLILWVQGAESEQFYSIGSLVMLSSLFMIAAIMGLIAVVLKPYNGPCPLFSGLGGYDLRLHGRLIASIVGLGIASFLGMAVFAFNATHFIRAYRTKGSRNERSRKISHTKYVIWTILSIAVWLMCVLSIELTIKKHSMMTQGLGDQQFGQWMSLCASFATLVTFGWNIAEFDTRRRSLRADVETDFARGSESEDSEGRRSRDERISTSEGVARAQIESVPPSDRKTKQRRETI